MFQQPGSRGTADGIGMLVSSGSRIFLGASSVLLQTVGELALTFNLYISCLFACESSEECDLLGTNDEAKSISVTNLHQEKSNLSL